MGQIKQPTLPAPYVWDATALANALANADADHKNFVIQSRFLDSFYVQLVCSR